MTDKIGTFGAHRIMELWESDFSAKLHIDKQAEHWAYRLGQAGVTDDSGPELYASFQRGWFSKRKPSLRDFLAHCRDATKKVKIAPGEEPPKEACVYCNGTGYVDVVCPMKEHMVFDPLFVFGKPYVGEFHFYRQSVPCRCTNGKTATWAQQGPEWFRLREQVLDTYTAEHKTGFKGGVTGMVMRKWGEYAQQVQNNQGQPAQPRPTARQRVSPSATTPPAHVNEPTPGNRQAAPLLDVPDEDIPF